MKSIQISKLLLAILVISSFSFVGIAIAYRNVWLSILAFVVGFLIMGYGITLKRKNMAKE
ncbi:DUF5325 family protein [Aquibacillus saliphilus]|uniref:DUF5325 family protein n=1 Tax=Aquibacillus saliphilus TaxID=1909422 RepID=UPI001CF0A1C0|nr:DUF5325 family protein [Aquibacillus saliphilus]